VPFASNNNYYLCDNGKHLTGVQVTIDLTEDMICALSTANFAPQIPTLFSIQLNAYSTLDGAVSWQQFIFTLTNTAAVYPTDTTPGAVLSAMVETWPRTHAVFSEDEINTNTSAHNRKYTAKTVTMPGQKIPANYQLIIALGNDGADNIDSATFSVYDNNKLLVLNETVPMEDLVTDGPVDNVTTSNLAPIVAFQLNIVGQDTGTSVLFSGAGQITYNAQGSLTAETSQPAYCAAQNLVTDETANSVYGALSTGASKSLIQAFGVITYVVGGNLVASPRFGVPNETDLFAVGSTGQLSIFHVLGGGVWGAAPPIGPVSFPPTGQAFAPPGAPLAVSQQFGAPNQIDVFVVGNDGRLHVFWSQNGSGWGGPSRVSELGFAAPPGAGVAACQRFGVANQTDVYVVDNNGQLNVFSVVGTDAWTASQKIGAAGFAPPGARVAASQQYGLAGQTDVFLVDNTGQLNVFWIEGASNVWKGPRAIGGPGFSAPSGAAIAVSPHAGVANQTDVFVVDNAGQLNVFWVVSAGTWQRAKIGPAYYPDPSGAPNALPGTPVAVSSQFGLTGRTDVFEVDVRGSLTMFSVQNAGAWSQSHTILYSDQLAMGPGANVSVSEQFGLTNQTDLFLMNSMTPWLAPGLGWPNVLWVDSAGSWLGPKALILDV
jgi:hypothetical protein